MPLAIFDLDNTLIGGDSDHSWGEFLVDKEIVDPLTYRAKNNQFYQDYQAGKLDIAAYVAFTLAALQQLSAQQRSSLHQQFMAEKIEPLILPKAMQLIETHRSKGDKLLIITATNRFITEPIAKRLGIPDILATDPEMINGNFSGRIAGTPCFQEGKVTRLEQWLVSSGENMEGSFFYSDSFNDIPLLEKVSFPYAVDPDEKLQQHANKCHWPIISLR